MTTLTTTPVGTRTILPGLALAVGIGAVATIAGHAAPVLGSAVPAVVLGVLVGVVRRPAPALRPGIAFAGKWVLQSAVVLLGLQLSLREVARVGLTSLPVMIGTLAACLVVAWFLGRRLGVTRDLRALVGVGTGICGASAIAAVAPVIGAVSVDVAYAISTIFLFNISAVLVFPLLGHVLGMSQHAFGLFAGTAVNDTSSVVAAATTYGSEATQYAVVVKLVRTLMIIPVAVALAVLVSRRDPAVSRITLRGAVRLVPWFLVGFVAMALVSSTGLVPAGLHHAASSTAVFFIAVALAGIGLSTDLAGLRRAGARPLLLGGALWLTVSATSLGLQALTGAL